MGQYHAIFYTKHGEGSPNFCVLQRRARSVGVGMLTKVGKTANEHSYMCFKFRTALASSLLSTKALERPTGMNFTSNIVQPKRKGSQNLKLVPESFGRVLDPVNEKHLVAQASTESQAAGIIYQTIVYPKQIK